MLKSVRLPGCLVLSFILCGAMGCGGGGSDVQQPQVNNGGGGAPAANPAGAPPMGAGMGMGMGMGAPAGAPGMANPGVANPAAPAAAPATTASSGSAPAASGGGGGNMDINSLIPPSLKSVVGANVAVAFQKSTPMGAEVLQQIRPLTQMLEKGGIKPEQIERLWAGTNRETGEFVMCVRTKGKLDAQKLLSGFGGSAGQHKKQGRGIVHPLKDFQGLKNGIGILDTRTALLGRFDSIMTALDNPPAGAARAGIEALNVNRPYFWVSGDSEFGEVQVDRMLTILLEIHVGRIGDFDLRAKGIAMGVCSPDGAAKTNPAGSSPGAAMPGMPAGMPGMPPGAPGMPPGAPGAPPGAPAPGLDATALGGTPPGYPGAAGYPGAPGATGGGNDKNNQVLISLAGSFESENISKLSVGVLGRLFDLADAADIAAQKLAEAIAARKAKEAADQAAADNASAAGVGGAGAGAGAGPMPPGAGPMPPGAMPPGAMPPGAAPPGMPGMPGAPGASGGTSKSRVRRPKVILEGLTVRVETLMPISRKKEVAAMFPQAALASGVQATADGFSDGTLTQIGSSLKRWSLAKPGEFRGSVAVPEADRNFHHSWLTQLLPYLGRDDLYVQFDFKKAVVDERNIPLCYAIIPEFLNPASEVSRWRGLPYEGMALSHWVGISGVEDKRNMNSASLPRTDPRAGIFGYDSIAKLEDISDGASSTLMIIGSERTSGPWAFAGGSNIRGARTPYFDKVRGFHSSGLSKPGAYAMMADGSTRIISADIDPEVFKALCTIHGAETIDMSSLAVIQGKSQDTSVAGVSPGE